MGNQDIKWNNPDAKWSDVTQNKLGLGCLGALILLIGTCGVLAGVAMFSDSGDNNFTDNSSSYAGGRSACNHFRNIASDYIQGFLTFGELRDKIKEVQQDSSTAEPAIKKQGAAMLKHLLMILRQWGTLVEVLDIDFWFKN